MDLIENIELLIRANKEYKKNESNHKLMQKRNKLKYYLLMSIKNSPEKSFLLKNYLEEKILNMRKEDRIMGNENYAYLSLLYGEIEVIYIDALKDLTLNQKRVFFERNQKNSLNKKKTNVKKKTKIYANV